MDYSRSFSALERLADPANRSETDISPTLLRALTDLYVTKHAHSHEEERQYTELAMRLLDVVDVPARFRLAQQLAGYSQAPKSIVRRLAYDVFAVAEPILRHAQVLSRAELLAIAKDAGPSHVAAVAARDDMMPPVRPEVAAPATAPLMSDGVADIDLNELFYAANATERRLILLNLDYAARTPAPPIAALIAGEAARRMEAAALSHNVELFVRELARALVISHAQARRIAGDLSGEPLVIAAKALSMPAHMLQRILLCLNPVIGQSVQRVYDLADLYEALDPEAARRMLAIWQTIEQKPQRATHQPLLSSDESRVRPAPTTWERRFPQAKPADRRFGRKQS